MKQMNVSYMSQYEAYHPMVLKFKSIVDKMKMDNMINENHLKFIGNGRVKLDLTKTFKNLDPKIVISGNKYRKLVTRNKELIKYYGYDSPEYCEDELVLARLSDMADESKYCVESFKDIQYGMHNLSRYGWNEMISPITLTRNLSTETKRILSDLLFHVGITPCYGYNPLRNEYHVTFYITDRYVLGEGKYKLDVGGTKVWHPGHIWGFREAMKQMSTLKYFWANYEGNIERDFILNRSIIFGGSSREILPELTHIAFYMNCPEFTAAVGEVIETKVDISNYGFVSDCYFIRDMIVQYYTFVEEHFPRLGHEINALRNTFHKLSMDKKEERSNAK